MNSATEDLKHLGISLDSSEFMVLQTIIRICQTDRAATFKQIQDAIEKERGVRRSRTWIYKILSSLQKSEFITTNRFPGPYQYCTDKFVIAKAIERKKREVLDHLEETKKHVEGKIALLQASSARDMAEYFHNQMVIQSFSSGTIIVSGLENSIELTNSRVIDVSGEGDIVRVITQLKKFSRAFSNRRVRKTLQMALQRKSVLRILLRSNLEYPELKKTWSEFFHDIHETLTYDENASVRVVIGGNPSYRFAALNDERITLFLDADEMGGSAIFLTRTKNKFILNDAIATFEQLWQQAIDVKDILDGVHDQ